jgi:hypothetical protein
MDLPTQPEPPELLVGAPDRGITVGVVGDGVWPTWRLGGAAGRVEQLAELGLGLGGDHDVGLLAGNPASRKERGPETATPIGTRSSGLSHSGADSTSKCLPRKLNDPSVSNSPAMTSRASSSISWRTPTAGQRLRRRAR